MKIRITSDGSGSNTSVTTEDGTPLMHCMAVDVSIRPEEVVKATLVFMLPITDMKGFEVTVSEAHLRELAEAHGFNLVKKDE